MKRLIKSSKSDEKVWEFLKQLPAVAPLLGKKYFRAESDKEGLIGYLIDTEYPFRFIKCQYLSKTKIIVDKINFSCHFINQGCDYGVIEYMYIYGKNSYDDIKEVYNDLMKNINNCLQYGFDDIMDYQTAVKSLCDYLFNV